MDTVHARAAGGRCGATDFQKALAAVDLALGPRDQLQGAVQEVIPSAKQCSRWG
jgi:hypothetical protein